MHFTDTVVPKDQNDTQTAEASTHHTLIKLTSDSLSMIKQQRRFSRDFSKEMFLITNSLIVENSRYSEMSYVCDQSWDEENEEDKI